MAQIRNFEPCFDRCRRLNGPILDFKSSFDRARGAEHVELKKSKIGPLSSRQPEKMAF